MKHKFSLIWRVAVALVLVLSFSLVAAVPVTAEPDVSDVHVELYNTSTDAYKKAEAGVTYYIYFTPGVALTANVDTITVRFPAGTSLFTVAHTSVDPDGDSAHSTETACVLGMVAGYNLQVTTPVSISAGTEAYLKVTGIKNPTWTGVATTKAHTLVLYTSQETTEVTSAAYILGNIGVITTVTTVAMDPANDVGGAAEIGTAGAADDWRVTFVATTGLTADWDTITVTFPPDVYVPSSINKSYILVEDAQNDPPTVELEKAPTIVGQSVTLEVPTGAGIGDGETVNVWFKVLAGIRNPTLATNDDPPNNLVHKGSYIGKVKTSKDSGIMRDDGFGVAVNGASPSVLGIKAGSPTQVLAGIASDTITVQSKDVYGNLSEPAGAVSVTLASSSTTALFDGEDTGNAGLPGTDFDDTTTTIAGSSADYEAIFKYKDSVVGTATITASYAAMGWTPATWDIEVMAANEVYLYHGTDLIGTYGTITAALADAMPGQTVKVPAGTYSEATGETFPITLDTASVTLEATGEAIINAVSNTTSESVIVIAANSVTVDGLTVIRKSTDTGLRQGIYVFSGSSVTIQNCTVIDGLPGIAIKGLAGLSILNNDVHRTCNTSDATFHASAIYQADDSGLTTCTISGNTIYGHRTNAKTVGTGIHITGGCNGLTITDNTVYNCAAGINVVDTAGAVQNCVIRGNEVYNNYCYGIGIQHQDTTDSIDVLGNNVYENDDQGILAFGNFGAVGAEESYALYNNIYGNPDDPEAGDPTVTTVSYGIWRYNAVVPSVNDFWAKHNWWGDASGPTISTNPAGTGDRADTYTSYSRWLSATIVKGAAAFTHDAATLTGKTTAGVDVSGVDVVGASCVGAARYTANPRAAITEFTPLEGGFFDVFVEEAVPVTGELITINFYPSGVTADSVAWYWSTTEGDWVKCSEQGYSALGFVWVKCRHEASVTPPATEPTAEGLAAGVQFVIGTEVPVRTLESIAVTPATASIGVGGTKQFTATGTYNLAPLTEDITTTVTWASSVLGVATIDAAGLATGVAEGTTNITATLGTIVSAPAVLTVSVWDPMVYDEDEDGVMEIGEVLNAISDYFAEEITITQVLEVIALYF